MAKSPFPCPFFLFIILLASFCDLADGLLAQHVFAESIQKMWQVERKILTPLAGKCGKSSSYYRSPNEDFMPEEAICNVAVRLEKICARAKAAYWAQLFVRNFGDKRQTLGRYFDEIRSQVWQDLASLQRHFYGFVGEPMVSTIWNRINARQEEGVQKMEKQGEEDLKLKKCQNLKEYFRQKVKEFEVSTELKAKERNILAYELLESGLFLHKLVEDPEAKLEWALEQFGADLLVYNYLMPEVEIVKKLLEKWPIGRDDEQGP